jgi:DNA replication and repair protein RecF
LRLKTTTVGAHRDDILLLLNGKDARSYASQGQQRTLALSLKIAELKIFEAALNEKPILLLDDVFSELDKSRQNRLIKLISGWQTIITATEFSPSDFAPAKVFPMKH